MRALTFLLTLCSFIFFSCQKEVDFANGSNNGNGGNGNTAGTVLAKIVTKSASGADSSVILFGFNSSQKLMSFDEAQVVGGAQSFIKERVERDGQGVIQQLILKNDQYQQLGLDSVVSQIGSSGGKYLYQLTVFDLGGSFYKDSVAINYDANGRVVSQVSFADAGSGTYDTVSLAEYTYTGSNIATIKYSTYDPSTSTYTLGETFTYDGYDNKISPTSIGNEAFVFISPEFYSANNPTSSSIVVPGAPTETYSTVYTYSSANRPLTGTSTIQPGGQTQTETYYYQ